MRVVIVGNGMAGARLVDDLLARHPRHELSITVVGDEPYGPYNRILLSDVVAGRADVAALSLGDPDVLASAGVAVRTGTAVTGIDRTVRTVSLEGGATLPYDHLVLATGAEAFVPPVPGLTPDGDRRARGVHVLRTLDDCREIVAACANARTATVLGGGLLGLEAARGLARRGLDVTVLHAAPHVMERQLDGAAGTVLARTLRGMGVEVVAGTTAGAVLTHEGRLTGVELKRLDGEAAPREVPEVLATDLLIVSCGVIPRAGLARGAGLEVGRGIVVDDELRTSDPRVFAIGDCAEHRGVPGGLLAPAWEQARVVAEQLTGAVPDARYTGHTPVTRLKAADLDVASAGDVEPGPWSDEPGLEVVQLVDPGRGRYVKAVVRDGVVVGATCVGEPRAAAELLLLVDRGSPAPADRSTLLLPGARAAAAAPVDDPTLIPDRATICRCNGVTKGGIAAAWSDGARTVEGVAAATRATTGCGSCRETVCGLLDWLRRSDPDPDPGTVPAVPTETPDAVPTGGTR